jgi:hypothetical protein
MNDTSSPRRPPPAIVTPAFNPFAQRAPHLASQDDDAAVGGDCAAPAAAVCGAGGALRFEVTAAPQGIHVVRTHRRTDGSKVHCSVLFDDLDSFTDWLDADPMRFTHPLVFQQVRRCFQQLAARGRTDESPGR